VNCEKVGAFSGGFIYSIARKHSPPSAKGCTNFSSMELAEQVVRGKVKLGAAEMRMLIKLLPFIAPKLSAIGVGSCTDFASKWTVR